MQVNHPLPLQPYSKGKDLLKFYEEVFAAIFNKISVKVAPSSPGMTNTISVGGDSSFVNFR